MTEYLGLEQSFRCDMRLHPNLRHKNDKKYKFPALNFAFDELRVQTVFCNWNGNRNLKNDT